MGTLYIGDLHHFNHLLEIYKNNYNFTILMKVKTSDIPFVFGRIYADHFHNQSIMQTY